MILLAAYTPRYISVLTHSSPGATFAIIFLLRYTRFLGHIFGYYWLYTPSPVYLSQPSFTGEDVSVILPTVEPNGPDFEACVVSILRAKPANLFVVTVGNSLLQDCKRVLADLKALGPFTTVSVSALPVASKRKQVAHAVSRVTTPITILADDHVFWPSDDFIASIVAPFENKDVGAVAPAKRVIRTTEGEWSFKSILNFLACGYLQRHNWELRASNAIDGGVFVISGRTAAYRTHVLQAPGLLHRLCNETFFFGLFGGKDGLGPDDDNFLTREVIYQGLKIKFQDTKDATIVTTLGEWPKFRGQLVR